MPASSRHHAFLLRQGAWTWSFLHRACASERRHARLAPSATAFLACHPVPVLPEAGDLDRRPQPWTAEEEFLLARTADLLRAALCALLAAPCPQARALACARLSPYSRVLQALPRRGADLPAWPPARLALLEQRLEELRRVQHLLVTRALPLVAPIARRYAHNGVAVEDLVQEGSAALLRAVERYDRLQGVRFSHYAPFWIQQGILKALSCQARVVRLPVYLVQILQRVRRSRSETPGPLDAAELAQRSACDPARLERALRADRSESGLTELLADPRPAREAEAPQPEELRHALHELLEQLPERESRILRLRYGLDGGAPCTLEDLRAKLGVSRERVRQLQLQALERLQRPAVRRVLERYC